MAAEKRDPKALQLAAHSLKSSSAYIGAMRLSALAKELEMTGRSSTLDATKEGDGSCKQQKPAKKGKELFTYNAYSMAMLANKRIPVTESVWVELSGLKSAGQTYSDLLEEMIEDRKKARLFRDMERIEEEDEFAEFPW